MLCNGFKVTILYELWLQQLHNLKITCIFVQYFVVLYVRLVNWSLFKIHIHTDIRTYVTTFRCLLLRKPRKHHVCKYFGLKCVCVCGLATTLLKLCTPKFCVVHRFINGNGNQKIAKNPNDNNDKAHLSFSFLLTPNTNSLSYTYTHTQHSNIF